MTVMIYTGESDACLTEEETVNVELSWFLSLAEYRFHLPKIVDKGCFKRTLRKNIQLS